MVEDGLAGTLAVGVFSVEHEIGVIVGVGHTGLGHVADDAHVLPPIAAQGKRRRLDLRPRLRGQSRADQIAHLHAEQGRAACARPFRS